MEFLPAWVGALLAVGAALLGATLAILWLRSELRKMSHEEAVTLATTRGKQISDLKNEMSDVRTEVAELRAMVKALEDLNAERIAAYVVAKLVETPGITISVGP